MGLLVVWPSALGDAIMMGAPRPEGDLGRRRAY